MQPANAVEGKASPSQPRTAIRERGPPRGGEWRRAGCRREFRTGADSSAYPAYLSPRAGARADRGVPAGGDGGHLLRLLVLSAQLRNTRPDTLADQRLSVAGLQQPMALALVVLMLPICWVLDRINIRNNRKHAGQRECLRALPQLTLRQNLRLYWARWNLSAASRWLTQIGYLVIIFFYGWLFVSIFAGYRADAIRRGAGPQVTLRLDGEAVDLRAGGAPTWTYLGAVSNYVFVYDHVAKQAMILPVNAIARIQPAPVKGKPALPFPVVHLP